ncbi:hypothetical protein LVD15_18825 [Fulvivirga maritima]|uniref:hypothetical protein n=1 Tax=Fulvivirga maritima TaxID=2904247 RepID=UPI001F481FEB|nr:hypothetical protein [Fulvivirga maritima]UII25342.1 hypothetical protein LVD15_18825 [Fulvivirga maritima]
MKKVVLFSYVALLGLFFSCGSDDDGDTAAANGTIEIGDDSYSATSGIMVDFGSDGTHYNIDFTISDGTVNTTTGDYDGSFMVYAELFAPGSSFSTGTFTYDQSPEDSDYYFTSASITLDANDNNELGDLSDDYYFATGGTIILSGGGDNYTITYNLTLNNGSTLTGSASGRFQSF